mgnify:FL=1
MTDEIPHEHLRPENCISFRLRRTARAAAKQFDDALRPAGIRNTQFTLLAMLHHLGEASVSDLCERLGVDQTTLTRNLDVLFHRGLVENVSAEDARFRITRLTDRGKVILDQALPLWRSTQSQLLAKLRDGSWTDILLSLQKIERACD